MKNRFGKKIGKISFSFNLQGVLKKTKKLSYFGKENLPSIDTNGEGSLTKSSFYSGVGQN